MKKQRENANMLERKLQSQQILVESLREPALNYARKAKSTNLRKYLVISAVAASSLATAAYLYYMWGTRWCYGGLNLPTPAL